MTEIEPATVAGGHASLADPQTRAARRPVFVLRGSTRIVFLVLHALATASWFGIGVGVVVVAAAARMTADESFAHDLYRVLAASPPVSVTAGLLVILTGTVMGLGTQWGLIRYWFLIVKALIAITVVTVDAVLIVTVADNAVPAGRPALSLVGAVVAHLVVLVIATALGVIKPRGLTPWGRRVLAARRRVRLPAAAAR